MSTTNLYAQNIYDNNATSTQCDRIDPITGILEAANCVTSLNGLNGVLIATGTLNEIQVASGTGNLVFSFPVVPLPASVGGTATTTALGSNAFTSTGYLPLTGGTLTGNLNLSSGKAYQINNTTIANGSTTLDSYFFGNAGNTSTTGVLNSAVGFDSLFSNTTGTFNTAIGGFSLSDNTTGTQNTAVGYVSLGNNTGGSQNSGLGDHSLSAESIGNGNVGLGWYAGAYWTGSNAFFVNNIIQSTVANDKNYSLLYGNFAGVQGTTVGQFLTVNGTLSQTKAVSALALLTSTGTISAYAGDSTCTGSQVLQQSRRRVA